MSDHDHELSPHSRARRELLQAMAAAGGVVATRLLLPAAWSTPLLASMPLPAHAALSSSNSQPQNGSGTAVAGAQQYIRTTVTGTKVELLVSPPPDVLRPERKQYQVYERLDDKNATPVTKFVRIVALMVPTEGPEFAAVTVELERVAGTYEYQLRWDGGHTEWITVTVP